MSKAIEQSVKQKLKTIEKEQHIPFNRLLDTLFLERILVRIGKSKYRDQLIFKGGMCLAHFLDLNRSTKDIDFLLQKIDSNKEIIKSLMVDIASSDIGDTFTFSNVIVDVLSLKHKKYPGYRISMIGQLGQIRNKVSIDVGVGDVVKPKIIHVTLLKAKHAIFEDSIELNAYPPEYIFSEKLESIIYLGEINGRMKDYFDCYRLIVEKILGASPLIVAIKETFSERKTAVGLIPNEFIQAHEKKWAAFQRKEKCGDLSITTVINTINNFLIDSNITTVINKQ